MRLHTACCLLLLLALSFASPSDCRSRRRGRAMKRRTGKEAKLPRKWFGPVVDATRCEVPAGGELEMRTTEDRPSGECEEAGETFCLCMESLRSLSRRRRLTAGDAGIGKRRRGGRRGRGRRRGGNRRAADETVEEEEDGGLNEVNDDNVVNAEEPQAKFKYTCGTCSFKWEPGRRLIDGEEKDNEGQEADNETVI